MEIIREVERMAYERSKDLKDQISSGIKKGSLIILGEEKDIYQADHIEESLAVFLQRNFKWYPRGSGFKVYFGGKQ